MKLKSMVIAAALMVAAASLQAASEPAAIEVLERYEKATGGEEGWAAVKNFRTVAEAEVFGSKRTTTRFEERTTGRFYSVTEAADGKTEAGFDGTNYWRKSAHQRGALPETDVAAMKRARLSQPLRFRENGLTYRRVADETIDGKLYHVLATSQMDERDQQTAVKHYFDPETHLLSRTVRGDQVKQTVTYADYRKTGSVVVPFESRQETSMMTMSMRTKEWTANVELKPEIFSFGEPLKAAPAAAATPGKPRKIYKPEEAVADDVKLEAFNTVWSKINDSYWDPTFGGKDWKAIGDAYRPRVMAAKSSLELHTLLHEMVNQLGQTHFRVTGPENTVTLSSAGKGRGTLGLNLRALDGQVVVTDLKAEHAAAKAGVRKGFVIDKVNGTTPLALAEKMIKSEPALASRPDILLQRAVLEELRGPAGAVVELDVRDENDKPLHLSIARSELPLGQIDRDFESKRVADGKVGYIRLDAFFGDVASRTAEALKTMADAETVILDLRGNGGGAGDLAPTIAGLLSTKKGSLGHSRFRYSKRDFSFEPAAGAFAGKLIILTDNGSASTSEVLAGGLQESGRAKLIGTRTRGAVLPSIPELLPTGGSMQYVVSDFRTPKGVVLEGRGLYPDVEVKSSRADVIAGRDPVLDRAVAEALRK